MVSSYQFWQNIHTFHHFRRSVFANTPCRSESTPRHAPDIRIYDTSTRIQHGQLLSFPRRFP
jgi:hypothetical protein